MQRVVTEHGLSALFFEIVEECAIHELDLKEVLHIRAASKEAQVFNRVAPRGGSLMNLSDDVIEGALPQLYVPQYEIHRSTWAKQTWKERWFGGAKGGWWYLHSTLAYTGNEAVGILQQIPLLKPYNRSRREDKQFIDAMLVLAARYRVNYQDLLLAVNSFHNKREHEQHEKSVRELRRYCEAHRLPTPSYSRPPSIPIVELDLSNAGMRLPDFYHVTSYPKV